MNTLVNFVIINLKLSFRIKAAFFFTLAFPMVFYFVYVFGFGHDDASMVPHVLAALFTFVIVSNSIYGVSVPLIMSREYGMFRQYYLAPVNSWQILFARMLTSFVVLCIVLVTQIALTWVFFGLDLWQKAPAIFLVAFLGSLAISSIGCLVSCLINSVQAGQIANQLVFIALIVFSGATVPLRFMPEQVLGLSNLLPSTQLYKAMEGVLAQGGTMRMVAVDVSGLVVFFVLVFGASLLTFRWDTRNKVGMMARSCVAGIGICVLFAHHLLSFLLS